MALMRDRPYGNSNFLVDLGHGDTAGVEAGFCEVIFPECTNEFMEPRSGVLKPPGLPTPLPDRRTTDLAAPTEYGRLILKRGVIGSLDLYEWWNRVRHGERAALRTVTVRLLAEDRSTVVLTWRFNNAYPVGLTYSPLRAIEGGIVMEIIELAFDRMDMR